MPVHAYGDYAHAARAWGLQVVGSPDTADLVWACEPSSPLGHNHGPWPIWLGGGNTVVPGSDQVVVVDCAYAPLRLHGTPGLRDARRQHVWQLFSPNKALGLTGVRAAYGIAPVGSEGAVAHLDALAPSWVLGAHGVAMLHAWTQAPTQIWLQDSLVTLRGWKARQLATLHNLGWTSLPSDTPYFCARPPEGVAVPALCDALRIHGIKLRDATSFGLPEYLRVGMLAPKAQHAVAGAWQTLHCLDKSSDCVSN